MSMREFIFLQTVYTDSGVHPTTYFTVTGFLSIFSNKLLLKKKTRSIILLVISNVKHRQLSRYSIFFSCGVVVQHGPWPPHSRGFQITHSDAPQSVGLLLTGDQLRRTDLYLTTHNTHNRQTSMSPMGFEPTVSAGERSQTYDLDGAVTGTGSVQELLLLLLSSSSSPLTAIEFLLGGSSPYTSTDKTNNIHKRNNTKTQCKQYKTQ